MSRINSFPPVVTPHSRILILGSMPGVVSLAAQEYYAHPRNHFWPLMAELLGFDRSLPYGERIGRLETAGVALWDVLQSCERKGSLDSNIEQASLATNDFNAFFDLHPAMNRVYFNGTAAEQIFRKRVLPGLRTRQLELIRLPSTSPANAGVSYAQKLAMWSSLKNK